jgi:hypothetical protein
VRSVAPAIVAVDEHRHEEGPDAGNGACLDRRENSTENAAENDDQRYQSPGSVDRDAECVLGRHGLAARMPVAVSDDEAEDDEREAEQKAGKHTGHE